MEKEKKEKSCCLGCDVKLGALVICWWIILCMVGEELGRVLFTSIPIWTSAGIKWGDSLLWLGVGQGLVGKPWLGSHEDLPEQMCQQTEEGKSEGTWIPAR